MPDELPISAGEIRRIKVATDGSEVAPALKNTSRLGILHRSHRRCR